MSKQIRTPLGKMYPIELLTVIVGILIVISMTWFASTVTQYVVAAVAIVSALYGAYDLSRSNNGGFLSLSGLFGLGSLCVTVLMIIIYVTTLF